MLLSMTYRTVPLSANGHETPAYAVEHPTRQDAVADARTAPHGAVVYAVETTSRRGKTRSCASLVARVDVEESVDA